ncbi:unnamed protein product [Somion occarium]|uniref:F-box domain-containing protein n=1 Tax=Somion occarium TaxID=3059160 RepID=A0ABP1CSY5_9APHY
MLLIHLPAELLLDIFALACNDARYTGCSLVAVSQHFRALCLNSGVDIRNVAVHGVDNMKKFVTMLEGRGRPSRRIKHLFLTDRAHSGGVHEVTATPAAIFTNNAAAFAGRILRIISPHDLCTLSIVLPRQRLATPASPSILTYPFTSLTDLTLHGALDPPFFDACHPFPGLRRLHIAAYHQLPEDLGSVISKMVPNLSHFKLTGIGGLSLSGNLLEVLQAYTNVDDSNEASVIVQKLPPSIHTVIIGFATLLQSAAIRSAGRQQISYLQMAQSINQLAEEHDLRSTDGRRLIVWPPPAMRSESDLQEVAQESYDKLRIEWEDGVAGRDTGWNDVWL